MAKIIKNDLEVQIIGKYAYRQHKMGIFDHKNLLSRTELLLAGRDKHPWGKRIGLSGRMVTRLFNFGEIPGPEYLIAIAKAENVCLNWLLTGAGAPYIVYCAQSDGEVASLAESFLSEAPLSWTVYWISSGEWSGLALHRPDQYELKDELIDYDRVELIAGPIGQQTLDALRRAGILQVREVTVPAATMIRLYSGGVGAYEMVRPDGLFERHELLNLRDGPEIREKSGGYVLEPDERILLEKYRRLKPADKTRFIAIGGALGEVERQEPEV
jgi:hypothetical protein